MTNAPDFCLDVLTGQVVPKNVHQKYHASGRYNPNDYVIAMWEMLHVQDGKEAAGGRLNTLMNLASIVAKQTVLERESTMSPMKALHAELPPEEVRAWLGDAKSSLGGAKSSLGDAKSSLGDAKRSLGDAKSSLGDAKSSLGGAKSSLGDAKSSLGDATSSLGDD
jgi:hypothetical protein